MSISDEQIGQEAGYDARQETLQLLRQKGPKLDRVLMRLRQAINAEETKIIKLKGAVNVDKLPKKCELIATTGVLIQDDDGEVFSTGESLLHYDVKAHGPRLRAIDLALQLHDAMPSKKHEHGGKVELDAGTLNAIISGLPDELAGAVCEQLSKLVSDGRDRAGTKE